MSHPFKRFAPAVLLTLTGWSVQLVAHPFPKAAAAAQTRSVAPQLGCVVRFLSAQEPAGPHGGADLHLIGRHFGDDPNALVVCVNEAVLGPTQFNLKNDNLIVLPHWLLPQVAGARGSDLIQVLRHGGSDQASAPVALVGGARILASPQALLAGPGAASSSTLTDDLDDMVRGAFELRAEGRQPGPAAQAPELGQMVAASADPNFGLCHFPSQVGVPSLNWDVQLPQEPIPSGFALRANAMLSVTHSPLQSGQATPAQQTDRIGAPLVVTNATGQPYRLTLTSADQSLWSQSCSQEAMPQQTEVQLGVPVVVPPGAILSLTPAEGSSEATFVFTLEASDPALVDGPAQFRWQLREHPSQHRRIVGSLARVQREDAPPAVRLLHGYRIDSDARLTIRGAEPRMAEASFEDLLNRALGERWQEPNPGLASRAVSVAEPSRPVIPPTPSASLAAVSVSEASGGGRADEWDPSMDPVEDEDAADDEDSDAEDRAPVRMQVAEDLVSLAESGSAAASHAEAEADEVFSEAEAPVLPEAAGAAEAEAEEADADAVEAAEPPAKRQRLGPAAAAPAASAQAVAQRETARRRSRFPIKVNSILEAWFFAHWDHPYPSTVERDALATQAGLTGKQVADWFTNIRKRAWIHSAKSKSDRVFGPYFAAAKAASTPSRTRKSPAAAATAVPQSAASSSQPAPLAQAPSNAMLNWALANLDDPYPSPEIKAQLASSMNLTYDQVMHWFINFRSRNWQSLLRLRSAAPADRKSPRG